MTSVLLLLAAMTVLPADRLAMADRLFNRAKYADAEAEYLALSKESSIAADEIMYRLAECDRALGRNESAMKRYSELAMKFPDSKRAGQCRFMYAMGVKGPDRAKLLAALDSDRVEPSVRAAALYNYGLETNSAEAFEKCVRVEPKGRYAEYANLRYGSALSGSKVESERRKGIEVLLSIAFGGGSLAEEALYLAAIQSYRGAKYSESGSLFRRYRRNFPSGSHADEAQTMAAWSDFMDGRYADAVAVCGEGESDDLAYILAASAYATGEKEKALKLFRRYLEAYPNGKYRSDAELPIARIEFDEAQKLANGAKTLESAKRGFALSKLAADELRLAWAYEKSSKSEEARAEYSLVAKNFPGSEEAAEALYRKAMIDANAENWSAVELSLAEALAIGKCAKYRGAMFYWRGVAALKIGHEQEGAEFLKSALKDGGISLDESREARLMLADIDLRAGRTEAAKAAYGKLVGEGACERMSSSRILSVGKLLGGQSAKTCAAALTKLDSPDWRQAGWAMLGDVEKAAEAYTAAIDAYRKCLAENARTESLGPAALSLGQLEFRAGEYARAEETLKRAVTLNAENARARAEAYLALAKNAEAKGEADTACSYATVVVSLFDDEKFCAEAKRILAAHPENAQ